MIPMNKNKFAPVPPMGWNSFDYYDTTVNEAQVRANADYMAAHLKEYGWEYIVVDIQWYAKGAGSRREEYQYIPFSELHMDEYSRLLPDENRFPSSKNGPGFKPLADYIHSLGLKFGIHMMRGIPRAAAHSHGKVKDTALTADEIADPYSISRWNPDMYGVKNTPQGQLYYDSLLALYASWGVDFIKCDDICNTNMYPHNPYSARHEIEMLHKAIEKTGRSIVLSLSPGPALIEEAWHYETYANMWRITDDFWDNWDLLKDMFHRCELWQDHVKPGCYPDCDMLPLGHIGHGFKDDRETNFTREEQRTMMTLWCLFGSPLMLGAEMTLLDDWTLSLLTNGKVLDMLTPACRPHLLKSEEDCVIWTAFHEKTNSRYLALFNLKDQEDMISCDLNTAGEEFENSSLTELWTGEQAAFQNGKLACSINAHGCKVFGCFTLP